MGDSTNAVVVDVVLVADDDDGMDVVVVYKFVVRHQLHLREAGATVYTKYADHPETNVRR
jgi:hypothetical protein